MDDLRSCYSGTMFFPGVGQVPIRWYFTDEDYLPFPHVYGSRNWIRERPGQEEPEDNQPGEVWGTPQPYYKGTAPVGLDCTGPFGSAEAWAGIVSTPTRMVCGFPGIGAGGQWQGGNGNWLSLGEGGQEQGGSGLFLFAGSGGQEQGGDSMYALSGVARVTWGTPQMDYPLPAFVNVLMVTLTADVSLRNIIPPSIARDQHLWIINETNISTFNDPEWTLTLESYRTAGAVTGPFVTGYGDLELRKGGAGVHLFFDALLGQWTLADNSGVMLDDNAGNIYPGVNRLFLNPANGWVFPVGFTEGSAALELRHASATLNGIVNTIGQSFAGRKGFNDGLANVGWASWIRNDYVWSADQTPFVPAADDTVASITTSGTVHLRSIDSTGLAGRVTRFLVFIHMGGGDFIVENEDGTEPTSAYRIRTATGAALSIPQYGILVVWRGEGDRWYAGQYGGGGDVAVNTTDGTILYGVGGEWIEQYPVTDDEGLIVTDDEGLIVTTTP